MNPTQGHALNREEQLPNFAKTRSSTSGIYAPAIRYHDGMFYLMTTLVHDKMPQDDPARWDNVRIYTILFLSFARSERPNGRV